MKALIVDDERNSREVLAELMKKFFPEVEMVGEAPNVESAYKLIIEKGPHLVFLDIEMPRGNGFSLLRKFDDVPFEVIFVTSYDHYAINAIKFSALDYLLKPIEVKDLKEAIEKAKRAISVRHSSNGQIVNLLHSIDKEAKDPKVAVHTGDKVILLESKSIIYIESDGRYCNIVTKHEHYTLAKYVKDFEDYFGKDTDFVRIHKSYLINTQHIKEYSKGEPFIITMSNGKSFEVARRKKPEVLERLR